ILMAMGRDNRMQFALTCRSNGVGDLQETPRPPFGFRHCRTTEINENVSLEKLVVEREKSAIPEADIVAADRDRPGSRRHCYISPPTNIEFSWRWRCIAAKGFLPGSGSRSRPRFQRYAI